MTNTLLAVFTGILAFAVLMQSVLFLLTFLNIRKLAREMIPQVLKLTEKMEETLAEIGGITESIGPVARKLAESAEIIHGRVVDVDGLLGEVIEKSRREIADIEDMLNAVTRRIRDSMNTLGGNILMPVHRINALVKGLRVAAGTLFSRHEKEKADEGASDDVFTDDDTVYF